MGNPNFLVADLWVPRPDKHRITLFTYMFGVESQELKQIKMVPTRYRFENHLYAKCVGG